MKQLLIILLFGSFGFNLQAQVFGARKIKATEVSISDSLELANEKVARIRTDSILTSATSYELITAAAVRGFVNGSILDIEQSIIDTAEQIRNDFPNAGFTLQAENLSEIDINGGGTIIPLNFTSSVPGLTATTTTSLPNQIFFDLSGSLQDTALVGVTSQNDSLTFSMSYGNDFKVPFASSSSQDLTLGSTVLSLTGSSVDIDLDNTFTTDNDFDKLTEQDNDISQESSTLLYPKGGRYRSNSSGVNGAIKITPPVGYPTSTMIKLFVSIYSYREKKSNNIILTGYINGSGIWLNDNDQCSATIITSAIEDNSKIRFSNDGGVPVIYIGESTTLWSYPTVTLEKVEIAFDGANTQPKIDIWKNGWSIIATQSITGTNVFESSDNYAAAGYSDNLYNSTIISNPEANIDAAHVRNPKGGVFRDGAATKNGAIKITIPPSFPSSVMMKMELSVFSLNNDDAINVTINTYLNGADDWNSAACTAWIESTNPNNDYSIRFAKDGASRYIYIGETSDSWSYPHIVLTDLYVSHTGANTPAEIIAIREGWDIGFESSAFEGTVQATVTNTSLAQDGYIGISQDHVAGGDIKIPSSQKIEFGDNSDNVYINSASTGVLGLFTNNSERLNFDATGRAYFSNRVGIGFSGSISSKLHILQSTEDHALSVSLVSNKSEGLYFREATTDYLVANTTTSNRQLLLGAEGATDITSVDVVVNHNLETKNEILSSVSANLNYYGNDLGSTGSHQVERRNAALIQHDSNTDTHIHIELEATTESSEQTNLIPVQGMVAGFQVDVKYILTFSNAATSIAVFGTSNTPANWSLQSYESSNGKPTLKITITGSTLDDTILPLHIQRGFKQNGVSEACPRISQVVFNTGTNI